MVKPSTLGIGIALIALCSFIVMAGIFEVSEISGIVYNGTNLSQAYNYQGEMSELARTQEEMVMNASEGPGVWQDVGKIATDTWFAVRVMTGTIGTTRELASNGVDQMNLGSTGKILKVTLYIIIILAIVGAIVSAALKWEV